MQIHTLKKYAQRPAPSVALGRSVQGREKRRCELINSHALLVVTREFSLRFNACRTKGMKVQP